MSEPQFIITVSREFGSGGHVVASNLAERFGVKKYDQEIIDNIAKEKGIEMDAFKSIEEKGMSRLATRHVRQFSNSSEDILFEMEKEYICDLASSGESMIIVGRCADSILKNHPGLIRVFIDGDKESKCLRVMDREGLDRKDALKKMWREDTRRRTHHNRHGDFKWGDSRHYDICIRSSIGLDETTDVLEVYIRKKIEKLSE